MRFLYLVLLLFLSKFTNGQRVKQNFDHVELFDNFIIPLDNWEQKNSGSETFIISEGVYTIKRTKETFFSISLDQYGESYNNFDISAKVRIEKSKINAQASGGIVFKAQKATSDALVLEINNNKQYRICIFKGGVKTTLTGNKKEGWMKHSGLNKRGFNTLMVRTYGNIFDVYINGEYVDNFINTAFEGGTVGFYAAPRSTVQVDQVILQVESSSQKSLEPDDNDPVKSDGDETYIALAQRFKQKSNQQIAEIAQLKKDLLECQNSLAIDTTIGSGEDAEIETRQDQVQNAQKVRELEIELDAAERKLAYLEELKRTVESDPNGDLILHLTKLLSETKEINVVLEKENQKLKDRIKDQ